MKKKKRAVTLIEILVVILLIGLISGALAFNMKGSMNEGKIFKTKHNKEKVYDILSIELAKGEKTEEAIVTEWEDLVKASPLAKGEETTFDGWKKKFTVKYEKEKGDFVVTSENEKK